MMFNLRFNIKPKSANLEERIYIPEPFQREIHESKARINIMIGAPGIGKTIVGAQESLTHYKHRVGNGLLVFPSFAHWADVSSLELKQWFPKSVKISSKKESHSIELGDGRYFFVRSAEHPESIDGLTNITFIWVDEPHNMPSNRMVLEKCFQRLERQRYGGAEAESDRLLFTDVSEIKGDPWVYDKLIQPAINGREDVFLRIVPLRESTRIPNVDDIYNRHPEGTWARNILDGVFAGNPEGLVWKEINPPGQPYKKWHYMESQEILIGADVSQGADPWVFVLLGRHGQHWTAFSEKYFKNGENELQIANGLRDWLLGLGLVEYSSSIQVFHDYNRTAIANLEAHLRRQGVNLRFTATIKGSHSVRKRLRFVGDLFIKKLLQIETTQLRYDIQSYRWKSKADTVSYSDHVEPAPEHGFSHGPDALSYALWSWLHSHHASPEDKLLYLG